MTQVSPLNHRLVIDPKSIFSQGYNPAQPRMLGAEAEFFAVDQQEHIAPPEVCLSIADSLKAKGYQASLEFSGIIEYAGNPYTEQVRPDGTQGFDLSGIVRTLKRAYRDFTDETHAAGYKLYDGSHVPHLTLAEAEAQVAHGRPRAEAGLKSMQLHAPLDCRLLPLMNASVQVSLNVRNDDELFETALLAYKLSPFIYAAFSNHPSIFNGNDCNTCHPRGKLYEAYGPAGGISHAFLQSNTPAELVNRHMEELYKTPLFFTYNPVTSDIVLPVKRLETLQTLPPDQRTVGNFMLAQSFNYHDNKICNVYDGEGNVTGKRVEMRGFDAGHNNMMAAPVFCALVMREREAGKAVNDLLDDFGFKGTPREFGSVLQRSRQSVVYHGGDPMAARFGQLAGGNSGIMRDFSRELGEILSCRIQSEAGDVREVLGPLLERCRGDKRANFMFV